MMGNQFSIMVLSYLASGHQGLKKRGGQEISGQDLVVKAGARNLHRMAQRPGSYVAISCWPE